jgi:hypothetical protein
MLKVMVTKKKRQRSIFGQPDPRGDMLCTQKDGPVSADTPTGPRPLGDIRCRGERRNKAMIPLSAVAVL